MDTLRLLLLEDMSADAAFLSKALEGKGFELIPSMIRSAQQAEEALKSGDIDAVLIGSRYAGFDPLPVVQACAGEVPVIVLAGSAQEYHLAGIMKSGADECVMIGDLKKLAETLRTAVSSRNAVKPARKGGDKEHNSLIPDVVSLAGIGAWESDLVSHTEKWSDELYQLLGCRSGETEPSLSNLLRRVHPEDVMRVTDLISDAIAGADRHAVEFRLVAEGTAKHVAGEMAVERDTSGKPCRIYGYLRDVTESRNAALKEHQLIADLMQRNKDLEQFAYIISHNLRGPVANIVGVSNTLLDDSLEEDETREFMGALSLSAKKLDNIITDLNHILQVKRNVNENLEIVSFQQLVDEIKSSIGVFLQDECIMIITDFQDVSEMFTLKSYMRSIFYNLISNSIKYRKPDLAPVIDIRSALEHGKVVLTFRDNSIGIDLQKKSDQVFGLYKRFHPDMAEGKGMGLYMVKTQVETLGGRISVQSKVNEGTEFRLEFELRNIPN